MIEREFTCKICGFVGYRLSRTHLPKVHGLKAEEYYLKYILQATTPICINPGCSNPCKFRDIGSGYPKCCSTSCHVAWQNKDDKCNFGLSSRYKSVEFRKVNGQRISKMRTELFRSGKQKPFSRKSIPYISPKAGEMILKSSYEVRACSLFDSNPKVITYKYESIRIEYLGLDNKVRGYYPDFELLWDTGLVEIVEIKPENLTAKDFNQIKFQAAKHYAEEHNATFTIMTESELQLI